MTRAFPSSASHPYLLFQLGRVLLRLRIGGFCGLSHCPLDALQVPFEGLHLLQSFGLLFLRNKTNK